MSCPQNFDVIKAFAFFGKCKIMFISIFMLLAVSIVIVLGEQITKAFFFKCYGFFIPAPSISKRSSIFYILDEMLAL